MTIKLPKPIEDYFDADRTGDPDAIAATFTEAGVVQDKGKTHRGRAAIREWMVEAGKLYTYTAEPFFIGTENGKTQVTAHVVGSFPGSPIDLRFFFVLAGDKVSELEITV
ncbi:nuclear transport factor 2 family protein [Shinella oryzae]|uniref:Nuclear transport factor 2 family protein n=1 Tax=Shinella oryzae TaxID=2871820 RepID=A0ABY9K4C8_9HYPH|nr:nuclear transport factor 2 family protein [Shinella oryzae]WLS02805.1 nuclear transport factor 2 family protein [Shinella oryzae]